MKPGPKLAQEKELESPAEDQGLSAWNNAGVSISNMTEQGPFFIPCSFVLQIFKASETGAFRVSVCVTIGK